MGAQAYRDSSFILICVHTVVSHVEAHQTLGSAKRDAIPIALKSVPSILLCFMPEAHFNLTAQGVSPELLTDLNQGELAVESINWRNNRHSTSVLTDIDG